MERADVFATINYQNSSNKEDKIEAFLEGYKYAHLEMNEEMKKFTMGFRYKTNEREE